MRRLKLASGLKPLTKAERKRLTRENRRALFPSVVLERYEASLRALELSRHIPETAALKGQQRLSGGGEGGTGAPATVLGSPTDCCSDGMVAGEGGS